MREFAVTRCIRARARRLVVTLCHALVRGVVKVIAIQQLLHTHIRAEIVLATLAYDRAEPTLSTKRAGARVIFWKKIPHQKCAVSLRCFANGALHVQLWRVLQMPLTALLRRDGGHVCQHSGVYIRMASDAGRRRRRWDRIALPLRRGEPRGRPDAVAIPLTQRNRAGSASGGSPGPPSVQLLIQQSLPLRLELSATPLQLLQLVANHLQLCMTMI